MTVRLPQLLSAFLLCLALGAEQKPKGAVPPPPPAAGPTVTAAQLVALKARSIGPAIMGGRVSDLAVDPVRPDTFYVGLATGGVWKTANAGGTFTPLFDQQPAASIGALAVAPSDAKVLWVGTGEANDRNSSGWGNGVYRSTDGGATWSHVGLGDSKAIPRIVVHPRQPDTAWVAVMGDLWTPGGARGLFKTTDAGKTWKAVLKAPGGLDSRVGCGDVVLDPAAPDTLYAALYARRRTPWSFSYGTAASDASEAALKKEGANVVGKYLIEANQTDVTADMTRMRNAGTKVILIWSVNGGYLSRIINTRAQMGWDVPIVGHPTLGSGEVKALLAKPENWEKVYMVGYRSCSFDADGKLPPRSAEFVQKIAGKITRHVALVGRLRLRRAAPGRRRGEGDGVDRQRQDHRILERPEGMARHLRHLHLHAGAA